MSGSLDDNTGILTEDRRRVETKPAVLDELRGLVVEQRPCLLCFEANYRQRHRTVLAGLLGGDTVNL